MSRQVQVHVSLDVPDDVTDAQILGWLPSLTVQVDEPVYGTDEAGNEQQFESTDVMLDLYVNGKCLTTVQH